MSKYTGKYDFRDLLKDKFNDDFAFFKDKTFGCLKFKDGDMVRIVVAQTPAELVPYYTHSVLQYSDDFDIILDEYSIYEREAKFIDKLNSQFSNVGFKPFSDKYLDSKKHKYCKILAQSLLYKGDKIL